MCDYDTEPTCICGRKLNGESNVLLICDGCGAKDCHHRMEYCDDERYPLQRLYCYECKRDFAEFIY